MPHWVTWTFACLAVTMAGFVRAYGGFGFSMIAAVSLSLVYPPVQIVPAVVMLEVVASLLLLPGVRRQVDWISLKRLMAGVLVGTPLGAWVLAAVPADPMRGGMALVVAALAATLLTGWRLKRMPGRAFVAGTGLVSGLLNGAAAIGGPPAILLFFSSPAGDSVSRATLIAFFLFTDILAAGTCAGLGLINMETMTLVGVCLLPMGIGLVLGKRAFGQQPSLGFRRNVLILLLALSAAAGARALW
ncbi:MAG: sulfite exporter TauE/SafE family protein [Desulfobacterales bacterium]|nr:sulfite exporter TauE/SafE family protein [Desulfobacterales bacterium]